MADDHELFKYQQSFEVDGTAERRSGLSVSGVTGLGDNYTYRDEFFDIITKDIVTSLHTPEERSKHEYLQIDSANSTLPDFSIKPVFHMVFIPFLA